MKSFFNISKLLLCLLFIALFSIFLIPASADNGVIYHIYLEGVINPIKVRYIKNSFDDAKDAGARLIVISINTPGGLVDSMEKIVETMVNSSIPVVTFVSPQAASATSAGTFIVLAGDIAVMTPGTTIGAAHPVGGQGEKIEGPMEDKVINTLVALAKSLSQRRNRNINFAEESIRSSINLTAEEAKETKAIDLLANDFPDLLKKLDGYYINHENRKDTVITSGCSVTELPLSRSETFLDAIANPTVAYILMSLGVMGLIYEFASPGIGLGAVAGSICLLLGLLSLSALPIHIGGILLLLLGLIMLILELKIQSHGILTMGGIIALVLGGFIMVDAGRYYGAAQEVKMGIVLPMILGVAALTMIFAWFTLKTLRSPLKMGKEGLIGMRGRAKTELNPTGMIFSDGALWEAESISGDVEQGKVVIVDSVSERILKVRTDEEKGR